MSQRCGRHALTVDLGPGARARYGYVSSKRILVVDDSYANARLLDVYLEPLQHQVRTALGAREALKEVCSFVPDLLLLDLQMPDVDGFEVARRLRQDPRTRDLPIIAVTGYSSAEHRRLAKEAGVDGFLVKPVHCEQLKAAVAEYI